jgi:hypothetical protein
MQISPVTVLAHKPDYRNIWMRATLSFLLMAGVIAGSLFYISVFTSRVNEITLYFVILLPFLSFMTYMRLSVRRSDETVQLTITENGLYQKPLQMKGTEVFTPWTGVKNMEEHLMGHTEAGSYVALHLTKPKETIIVSSTDIGTDTLMYFLLSLKRYRNALRAVNN